MIQWLRHAAVLAAVFLMIVIVVFYFYFSGSRLDGMMNSDLLILPQIDWNMANRSWGWFTQQQARLIGVFPDQLIYDGLSELRLGFRVVLPLQVCLTLFAEIVLVSMIISRLTQADFIRRLTASGAVFLGAPLVLATFVAWGPYRDLSAPMNHSGAFMLSLILALRLVHRPGDVLTSGLVFFGCFSDTLFTLEGVLPLVIANVAADAPPWPNVRAVLPSAPALISALCGVLAQRMVFHQSNVSISLHSVLASYKAFLTDLTLEPQLVFFVAVGAGTGLLLTYQFWQEPRDNVCRRKVLLFAMSSIALSLAAMMSFYIDLPSLRYAWPMIGWPLILLASLLAIRLDAPALLVSAVASVFLAIYLVAQTGWLPPVLAWRAADEVCVSEFTRKERLNAGLADFWHARRLVVSSDFALKIEQITTSGSAYLWGNDPYWFFHDWRRADGVVRYDYILLANLDRSAVSASYGRPDLIHECPTTEVWAWRDPNHVGPILESLSLPVKAKVRRPDRR